jgi:hypothetical protein
MMMKSQKDRPSPNARRRSRLETGTTRQDLAAGPAASGRRKEKESLFTMLLPISRIKGKEKKIQ